MYKKYVLVIALSIVLLLLCFGFAHIYHNLKLDLITVYIASHNLEANHLIQEEDLEAIQMPSSYVLEEVILNKERLIGSSVALDLRIAKGSFFLKDQVNEKGEGRDSDHRLLEMTHFDLLSRNLNVVPNSLAKGMRVDIYLTINQERIISDLLFQNVKIVTLYDENFKDISLNDTSSKVAGLCLELKDAYIPIINEAIRLGDLSLAITSKSYDENAKLSFNENARFKSYFSCLKDS